MNQLKELRTVFDEQTILERLDALAAKINEDYKDKPVVVICMLKGAFMFFSDLSKRLNMLPEVDFVRLASYGKGTTSSRSISFTKDIEISVKGKHVILVDDVVDTGHTMSFLLQQMSARGAASLKVAALVDKQERREVEVFVDYPGFTLSKGFIVGYGLDYAEKYRTLPCIYEALFE